MSKHPAMYLFLFTILPTASNSVDVRGSVQFQMSWKEIMGEVKHQVWVDGQQQYFPKLEAVTTSTTKRPESIRRRKRRSTDIKMDGSYVRHGANCVQKQKQLAEHFRKNPRIVSTSPQKTRDGTNKGIPGIAEAPPGIAYGRRQRVNQPEKTGYEWIKQAADEAAVEIGPGGGVIERADAVHIVVMVEEGEEARMACHYCIGEDDNPKTEEEEDLSKRPMIWYKLGRKNRGGYYRIREVNIDMHDDPEQNHVYVTEAHTLVVKETRIKHRGTYFCRYTSENGGQVRDRISEVDLANFFKSDRKLRFMYHLDVLKVKEVKAILVRSTSDENTGLPPPASPTNVTELNVVVVSSWQEWSLCSACGKSPGTRRRLGECFVTNSEIYDSPDARFSYLGHVLSFYTDGVPCRSSLLHGHQELEEHLTRPDEIQEEECQVSCTNFSLQVTDVGGKSKFKLESNVKVTERHFIEPEGDSLTIKCPSAPIDMPVAWINGSRILISPLLHRMTGGRVRVDVRNRLHIKRLLLSDTNHYICVVAGKVRGRMKLDVTPTVPDCKFCRYLWYLVFTFPVNFVVFITMSVVRHLERKKVLNYDLIRPKRGSDDDDDSSDDDITGRNNFYGLKMDRGDDLVKKAGDNFNHNNWELKMDDRAHKTSGSAGIEKISYSRSDGGDYGVIRATGNIFFRESGKTVADANVPNRIKMPSQCRSWDLAPSNPLVSRQREVIPQIHTNLKGESRNKFSTEDATAKKGGVSGDLMLL